MGDFKVGGNIIKTIIHTDDVVLIVKIDEELQKMANRLVATGREFGMEIKTKNTKVIKISKEEVPLRITVNNRELVNVFKFLYLGDITGTPVSLRISEKGLLWRRLFSIREDLVTGKLGL